MQMAIEKPLTAQAIWSIDPPISRPIVGTAITKPSAWTHTRATSTLIAISDFQRRGFGAALSGAGMVAIAQP